MNSTTENTIPQLNPEMKDQPEQLTEVRPITIPIEQSVPSSHQVQPTTYPNQGLSSSAQYYQGGYNPYSNHSYPPRAYPNYPQNYYPYQNYGTMRPTYYPSQNVSGQPYMDPHRRPPEQSYQYADAPPQAPQTQQLFRTHNPNQVAQIVIPNSEICGTCEKPGATIKCISSCKKFFHKECVDNMAVKTVNQSESNGSYFIQCENCLARIQRCQHCQQQGQIGLQMVKCSVQSCSFFFHKKCMLKEKEGIPQNVQQLLLSPVFICGAHHCHQCSQPFRIDEQVLRCVKCVTSYHEGCKDSSKIQQITSRQFLCTSHIASEFQAKKYNFVVSNGDMVTTDTRLGVQKQEHDDESMDEQGEEINETEGNQAYKRMRVGLSTVIESGELIQVQRQAESVSLSSSIFKSGMQGYGMGGPPSVNQSHAQWRRVDPSETMVLNQGTLSKVNDILQQELAKRTGGANNNSSQNLKALERQWIESFQKENAGKSIKRVGKIIKKMQKTDEILERQKKLFENKFEEFAKFVKGEYDYNLVVKMHE